MKITLNISDVTIQELKQIAARQGITLSQLAEAALQVLLQKQNSATSELPPLPEFRSGGARVDMANREVLYEVMER